MDVRKKFGILELNAEQEQDMKLQCVLILETDEVIS